MKKQGRIPKSRKPRPIAFGTTSVTDLGFVSSEPECVVHPPFQIPGWLLDMIRADAVDADIVETLRERLLSRESDLHEAQRILNWSGAAQAVARC
jgi:hypothetical protein